ncbi:MAG: rhodanese-like domain-containing protein [Pseudomonadota bacterium]
MAPPDSIETCTPDEAWSGLKDNPDALLIDVRTQAEWSFVGVPDLSDLGRDVMLLEWMQFPTMAPNAHFAETVMRALEQVNGRQVYFICRSGARSRDAAQMIKSFCAQQDMDVQCINVEEGFEGDLNGARQRACVNGWKARGLPWRQS